MLSFATRFFHNASPTTTSRFLGDFKKYLQCTAVEAALRERDVVLDLASYDLQRRENSAVPCILSMFDYLLDADLPDEIFYHPAYVEMRLAVTDMVAWSNVSDPQLLPVLNL